MIRGPPWVPMTAPMLADPDLVAWVALGDQVEEVVDVGCFAVGHGQVLHARPRRRAVSRNHSSDLRRVRCLAASSTAPSSIRMIGLIESIEPSIDCALPMRPPFTRFSRVSSAP